MEGVDSLCAITMKFDGGAQVIVTFADITPDSHSLWYQPDSVAAIQDPKAGQAFIASLSVD
jgi:hypothetical protein